MTSLELETQDEAIKELSRKVTSPHVARIRHLKDQEEARSLAVRVGSKGWASKLLLYAAQAFSAHPEGASA